MSCVPHWKSNYETAMVKPNDLFRGESSLPQVTQRLMRELEYPDSVVQ